METPKPKTAPAPTANPTAAAKPAPETAPLRIAPLFRRVDWLALLIAFGAIWITYMRTLAPEVTLEDSGELCTGAYYAGIPHPPGYPFWSIYAWLWTALLPIGNVAWRVEVGEATAAAFACGLVALMVSRGGSMLMEGIEELKTMSGKWESAICLVCGATAGILLGTGQTMWSESVAINRISLFGVPWVMTVAVCMMRWIYAPHQRRYLFIAMFFFGICATIHQTLLVAAMGIEAAIVATQPRLGRWFFLVNSLLYLMAALGKILRVTTLLDTSPMLLAIFHLVGFSSIVAYCWSAIVTKEGALEFARDGSLLGAGIFLVVAAGGHPFVVVLALGMFGCFCKLAWDTRKLGLEWVVVFICGALWLAGASFYFYEAIAGMTDPPMQWGYPRTVEGFFHALSRGQYEKANPTDLFSGDGWSRFITQLGMLVGDVVEEYNWVLLFVALVPLFFFLKMRKRERSWMIFLGVTYLLISVLLIILMNPTPDRQSADLHKVFFTSSHAIIAVMFGYGLILVAAYMATHYMLFRRWGLIGGTVAGLLALYSLWDAVGTHYFGPAGKAIGLFELPHWIGKAFGKDQGGLPIFGNLILVALPIGFLAALYAYRQRAPLAITLGLFAALPLYSGLSHWGRSEQRDHWFGYWFGHDMFTPPFAIYPEMTRDAILFGGTDPGRFCPTYMIFCESFTPHAQQPKEDQKFDRRDVYIITQNALADGTYLEYIRAHYNRSAQIDPPFFQELLRGTNEVAQGYKTNLVAKLAYEMLDKPFTQLGAKIEARRRKEGVYPPKEIYTPSYDDNGRAFSEYMLDAQQRFQHDQNPQFRNEPRQMKPGEVMVPAGDGRISVTGQTAVMSINGLLTKVIFDHNPTNEFFVEESFPLDWMYPYLSPFGIIMKINRQPVEEITEDMVKKDHDFWSEYSDRFIGNWITYDTPVKDICDFVEKVYLEHDYTGFKGNRKFIRDDQAQKSFSKLRGAIAGSIFNWHLDHPKNVAEQQRMLKETDFAYRQAFAFCPYSPEAVFRYVNFLAQLGRLDDAYLVAKSCSKLDPYNNTVVDLVKRLEEYKKHPMPERAAAPAPMQVPLEQLEKSVQTNPSDFQGAFNLASAYMQMQQKDKAIQVLDQLTTNPKATAPVLLSVAQAFVQLGNYPKVEGTLERLVQVDPESPESWYNLAGLKAALGKPPEAVKALRRALELGGKRLAADPKSVDLRQKAASDPSFNGIRETPEFKEVMAAR